MTGFAALVPSAQEPIFVLLVSCCSVLIVRVSDRIFVMFFDSDFVSVIVGGNRYYF
jgi:hypothetical protein